MHSYRSTTSVQSIIIVHLPLIVDSVRYTITDCEVKCFQNLCIMYTYNAGDAVLLCSRNSVHVLLYLHELLHGSTHVCAHAVMNVANWLLITVHLCHNWSLTYHLTSTCIHICVTTYLCSNNYCIVTPLFVQRYAITYE